MNIATFYNKKQKLRHSIPRSQYPYKPHEILFPNFITSLHIHVCAFTILLQPLTHYRPTATYLCYDPTHAHSFRPAYNHNACQFSLPPAKKLGRSGSKITNALKPADGVAHADNRRRKTNPRAHAWNEGFPPVF